MKTLIVGLSTRAFAESAVRSGYEVVALDAFGDMDLQALCECHSLRRDFGIRFSAEALLEASRPLSFDLVAYTSNLENYPEVVGQFASEHPVVGNSAEVLTRVRHWPTLFSTLARAGFRIPQTIYDGDGRSPDPARAWLLKPVRGGGGHGVTFWRDGAPPGPGFMLQEYVPGVACSASFVANGRDGVVVGLTEQLIGRTEFGTYGFRYCGNLLPLAAACHPSLGPTILRQVRQIAELITREFGLVGFNGIDFVLSDDRVILLEVNPRYSASMELVQRAYGMPVFDLHVRAARDGELPKFDLQARLVDTPFHGKAILFAEKDAVARDTPRWLELGIRDVPPPGEELSRGGPICTLLAQVPTRDGCLAELVARAAALKGEIYA
jgi:uncharacterized protein